MVVYTYGHEMQAESQANQASCAPMEIDTADSDHTTPLTVNRCRMRVKAHIKGTSLQLLVDSGAGATSFISREWVEKLGLPVHEGHRAYMVTYGNTEKSTHSETATFNLFMGGTKVRVQALILERCASPVILGDPWLKLHRGVMDYANETLSFTRNGRSYTVPASGAEPMDIAGHEEITAVAEGAEVVPYK
jgi:hypothetical protein